MPGADLSKSRHASDLAAMVRYALFPFPRLLHFCEESYVFSPESPPPVSSPLQKTYVMSDYLTFCRFRFEGSPDFGRESPNVIV